MNQSPLGPATEHRIRLMFTADDREAAREILQKECGNNLPFLNELDEFKLERYRFAALKLSGGDLAKLREVVTLANGIGVTFLLPRASPMTSAHISYGFPRVVDWRLSKVRCASICS
jgi:hypothetical protein